MEKLRSPLGETEYGKIEKYSKDLTVFHADNIEQFKKLNAEFSHYLVDLTEKEQARAWFYLRNISKQKAINNLNDLSVKQIKPSIISLLLRFTIPLIVVTLIFGWLYQNNKKQREVYTACWQHGVEYFKEIDSYPKLSTGENADEVAQERCKRSKLAFGKID